MSQDIQPLIRIAMYAAAGFIMGGGIDRETFAALLEHPETIEAVTALVVGGGALGWWRSAKKKGGPT